MRFTLVYDSGCGPCTTFKEVVQKLDVHHSLGYSGLLEADTSGVLDGIAPARRFSSFHLVSETGSVVSGSEALPTLASLLPGGRLLSSAMESSPPVYALASFAYSALSRLHGTGECSVPVGDDSP